MGLFYPSRPSEAARRARALVEYQRRLGLTVRRRRVPRQLPPDALVRDYAADLERVVARARAALAPMIAALPRLAERVRLERARRDAGEGDQVRLLADQAELAAEISDRAAEDLARRHGDRVSFYQREQLRRQVAAALGVALLLPDAGARRLIDGFAAENASVIRDLSTRVVAEVEQAGIRGVVAGATAEELNAAIERAFAAGDVRARMLATLQVRRLYAQLNEERQREMGVVQFVWRTMRDSKVRPWHRAREGEAYEWAHPPDGEVPGEPPNCRCYGEPVFADLRSPAQPRSQSLFVLPA